MIPAGLPLGTMIARRFVAKITGSVPLSPASVSLSMLLVSADAKTSAGAPCEICCTSAEEASKLNVTFASGFAAVNAAPMSVNAAVSEAAAKTVMSPSTPGLVVVEGAVEAEDDEALSSPHATRTSPRTARRTRTMDRARRMAADRIRLIVSS